MIKLHGMFEASGLEDAAGRTFFGVRELISAFPAGSKLPAGGKFPLPGASKLARSRRRAVAAKASQRVKERRSRSELLNELATHTANLMASYGEFSF